MNVPVEDLLQIISKLPKPQKAGEVHITILMPKVDVTENIAPPPRVLGRKIETEIVFISCSYYNEPFLRWTLEI